MQVEARKKVRAEGLQFLDVMKKAAAKWLDGQQRYLSYGRASGSPASLGGVLQGNRDPVDSPMQMDGLCTLASTLWKCGRRGMVMGTWSSESGLYSGDCVLRRASSGDTSGHQWTWRQQVASTVRRRAHYSQEEKMSKAEGRRVMAP